MNPATIVIADASCIHRRGITALLEKHFTHCIITETDGVDALFELLRTSDIDAVLAPVNMLLQNNPDAIHNILQQHKTRMILYSAQRDDGLMDQAFICGAASFFYSDESEENIIYKTEQVLQFGSCITPDLFNAYKAAHKRLLHERQNDKIFTQREKEILQLIETGYTTPQIAAQLSISRNTAQNHRNNMLRKTGCHNMAQVLLLMKENR